MAKNASTTLKIISETPYEFNSLRLCKFNNHQLSHPWSLMNFDFWWTLALKIFDISATKISNFEAFSNRFNLCLTAINIWWIDEFFNFELQWFSKFKLSKFIQGWMIQPHVTNTMEHSEWSRNNKRYGFHDMDHMIWTIRMHWTNWPYGMGNIIWTVWYGPCHQWLVPVIWTIWYGMNPYGPFDRPCFVAAPKRISRADEERNYCHIRIENIRIRKYFSISCNSWCR